MSDTVKIIAILAARPGKSAELRALLDGADGDIVTELVYAVAQAALYVRDVPLSPAAAAVRSTVCQQLVRVHDRDKFKGLEKLLESSPGGDRVIRF